MRYLTLVVFACMNFQGIGNASVTPYLNWGFGFDAPNEDSTYSDVQTYSAGVKLKSGKTFNYFAEMGGWKDPGKYKGAKPSAFGTLGIALDVNMPHHYAAYSIGPAYMTTPDTILGHWFQVYQKLSVGFKEDNKRIGVFVKHFSNAGFFGTRNVGRNFIGIEIGF